MSDKTGGDWAENPLREAFDRVLAEPYQPKPVTFILSPKNYKLLQAAIKAEKKK